MLASFMQWSHCSGAWSKQRVKTENSCLRSIHFGHSFSVVLYFECCMESFQRLGQNGPKSSVQHILFSTKGREKSENTALTNGLDLVIYGNIPSASGTISPPFCMWVVGRPQSQLSYQYGDAPAYDPNGSPETIHPPIQSKLRWICLKAFGTQ